MKATSRTKARDAGSTRETDLLLRVLDEPERLRERLVLAIALAPPKSRRGGRTRPRPGKRR